MAKSKGKNVVTLSIMGLLVLGLAGFGVTEFGSANSSVATVGKTEVSTGDYGRAIQAQLRRFQQQTGQALTFQQARAFGVDQMALGQLITSAALENEAAEMGLSVGDKTVGERIQNMPDFAGGSGTFDRALYESTLRQNGLNAGEFEARIRSDVAEALLQSAIGAGIETPATFVDTLYSFARETRDSSWLRLGAGDLETPLAAPTEADLVAHHTENSDNFMRPETKTIRYALLAPDMLVDDIEVDEAQLRTLYDSRIAEFVLPERRLVERLAYTSEEQAQADRARLDTGKVSFDDLVAERGLELSDVDQGDVTREDLGEAGEVVFALEGPGVAGPLPSDVGPALFRMNAILAAQETPFEDARDGLRLEAASDRARRMILDSRTTVDDLLAGGADMALLAERAGMEEGTIDYNVTVFEGIAAYAGFRNAAANAQPGDFAEVVELEDGGLAVLIVDTVEAPVLRPLDEVRDAVTEAWTRAATEAALTAQAETLIADLEGGQSFEDLGLAPEQSNDLARTGFLEGTPPDFLPRLFEMKEGELATVTADGDLWLFRLDAVNAPPLDTEESRAERDQFAAQSAGDFATAVLNAFSQAIVNEAGVELNQAAINAVHTQLP
ncbi:MAG: SurA N-terminal domain-containing protein [Silicimonas sp.]|nr:SurA N-terminal domain-containing protein [Silicimonas sp.]